MKVGEVYRIVLNDATRESWGHTADLLEGGLVKVTSVADEYSDQYWFTLIDRTWGNGKTISLLRGQTGVLQKVNCKASKTL